MKFKLKLVTVVIFTSSFVYCIEQKEESELYFENLSQKYDFENYVQKELGSPAHKVEKDMIKFLYNQWIFNNVEKVSLKMIKKAILSEFSGFITVDIMSNTNLGIQELIKNKVEVNDNNDNDFKNFGEKTLLMLMIEARNELSKQTKASYLDYNPKKRNVMQENIGMIKKSLEQLLPYVKDFFVKDKLGKTVFDYAKDDKEVTDLLNEALQKRKIAVKREINQSSASCLIPDIINIVCEY